MRNLRLEHQAPQSVLNSRRPKPVLFEYFDFRNFLADHLEYVKRGNPRFSYGSWAVRMGLSSTASLTRLVKGDRFPGAEITRRLCEYFRFSERERRYFENLVLLERVKGDPELKPLVVEKLLAVNHKRKFQALDHETFRMISNWYYFAIRELSQRGDFIRDPKWIAEQLQFKVSRREVSRALKTLESLGLIQSRPGKPSGKALSDVDWESDVAGEASKRNHEQSLENAKLALREVELEAREFVSACFNLESRQIPLAKTLIREFKERFIRTLERPHEGDATYQVQIQFFPLTNKRS